MSVPIDNVVNVDVEVSSQNTISSDFSLGLIMGSSVPDLIGVLKEYTINDYKTKMITDGFSTSDYEYKAVEKYFSQNEKPEKVLVGAYADHSDLVTEFNLYRSLNENFYFVCADYEIGEESDYEDLASAVESSDIPTILILSSKDIDEITPSSSLCSALKDKYNRTFVFYSNDIYVAPAFTGLMCAYNSGLSNSAYTGSYKTLNGITPENLSESDLEELIGKNGNTYCKFGNTFNFTYPAKSSGGYYIDELYLIDLAKSLIQQYAISGLLSRKKIPQTDSGVSIITSYISSACNKLVDIGLIGDGIWRGQSVLKLNDGDAINGYYVEADTVYNMSEADRVARKSPPIYVALLSSGSVEHIVIKVYVNR